MQGKFNIQLAFKDLPVTNNKGVTAFDDKPHGFLTELGGIALGSRWLRHDRFSYLKV